MQEIRDDAKEAETVGEHDEFIFGTKLSKDVLLEFLDRSESAIIGATDGFEEGATRGNDNFTGAVISWYIMRCRFEEDKELSRPWSEAT
jgi:hypothetical protein